MDECIICTEQICSVSDSIKCHKVHIECVKKSYKSECPCCRQKLNIRLYEKSDTITSFVDYEDFIDMRSSHEVDILYDETSSIRFDETQDVGEFLQEQYSRISYDFNPDQTRSRKTKYRSDCDIEYENSHRYIKRRH